MWEVTFCIVCGQTAVHSVWEVTFCIVCGQTAVHSVWEVTFCLVSGQTAVQLCVGGDILFDLWTDCSA